MLPSIATFPLTGFVKTRHACDSATRVHLTIVVVSMIETTLYLPGLHIATDPLHCPLENKSALMIHSECSQWNKCK